MTEDQLAEGKALLERARRWQPLDLEPKQPLAKQCLRDALAGALRVPAQHVPARHEGEDVDEYIESVGERFGVRFLPASADELPPPGAQRWIAIIAVDDEVTHAVPMVGRTALGRETMLSPNAAQGVLSGLVIEAT